jgi:hypothetical protein
LSDGPELPDGIRRRVRSDGAEVRVYDMAEHMMKMLMSIMAALSFGSLLFLVAIL